MLAPDLVKARLPVSCPAKVAPAPCVESVKTTMEPPEFVTVPPAPGSGFVLVSAATIWALFFRSTTAEEPLIVRLVSVMPEPEAVWVTSKVFAAPELRLRVPPFTTAVPVK